MGKKALRGILITIVFIIVALEIGWYLYASAINKPFINIKKDETVEVKESDTLNTVLSRLNEEGKMKNLFMVKVYTKFSSGDKTVKVGTYEINEDDSIHDLLNRLVSGKESYAYKVTIPEGKNIEEIASLVEKACIVSKDEFLKSIKEYPLPSYVKENPEKRYNLEGYLFPDTYTFDKGVSASEVIEKMIKRFESVLLEIENEEGITLSDDEIEDIVIRASIIEKEIKVDEERPIVAGVINNRLEQGMRLQMDATTVYATQKTSDTVTIEDTKVHSPYNTYYIKGLPVGPIASPGKVSIEAVLNPKKTDYIFYVLKKGGNGEHVFTDDYEEHKKNMEENGY